MRVFSARKFLEAEGIDVYAQELVDNGGEWLLALQGHKYSDTKKGVIDAYGIPHPVKEEWLLEVDENASLDVKFKFSPWVYQHTQNDYKVMQTCNWFNACIGQVTSNPYNIKGLDGMHYFCDIGWCEILLEVEL